MATRPNLDELVEAVLASPIGVVACFDLAREACGMTDPYDELTRGQIEHAADWVTQMPRAAVIQCLAGTAAGCSPFSSLDHQVVAMARAAERVRPVASSLCAAHFDQLTASADLGGQWRSFEGRRPSGPPPRLVHSEPGALLGDLSEVYECGEFPYAAVMTHDPAPPAATEAILNAADTYLDRDTTFFDVGVAAGARVHEVSLPSDWIALFEHGSKDFRAFRRGDEGGSGLVLDHGGGSYLLQTHASWDCEVRSVDAHGRAEVQLADGRTIAGVRGMTMPNWPAVAQHVDGVHFTWAGILTVEARFLQVRDGWWTTARHWGTPSTRWLRNVLGPWSARPSPYEAVETFTVVDPESRPARRAVESYFAELDRRFPGGFDAGDAGAGADPEALRPPAGRFIVVGVDGRVAGCGGVQRLDAETAEIKRMWVASGHRGHGLGRRLLARLEDAARELGCSRVVLDTNATLREAISLYESAGYTAVERYNDNPYAERFFAKHL